MSKIIDLNENKKKINKKKIFMNLLFIIAFIYIIYAIYLTIKKPTDTVTVESGTLTDDESSTGYIIREETIVKGNNYKNGIYQIVLEGKKAAKNETIFRYYSKNENNIQKKIDEINAKIQTAIEKENTFSSADINNLETQIDDIIQNLKFVTDVQDLEEYKKQISNIILKKATIAGENSKSGSYIKKLINKRKEYEEKLIDGSEFVTAPKSGVVSYRVDGLEEVLSPDSFDSITEEKLNELYVKTGKIVATSTEEAKVINNFNCYIATILNSETAKNVETGKSVLLTLSSGNEVDATVKYKKEQADGKMLIVFELNTLTDELISYRKISFNITWWSYSGIKVPNVSILEDNNQLRYVLKKTTTGLKKCYIKVLKTNDNYSIISSYSNDDLSALGLDASTYEGIDIYDSIMLYPNSNYNYN